MAGKKDARIASEKPRVEVTVTRHRCDHCGDAIRTNNILPVRRITFDGMRTSTRMGYYIRGHETLGG